MPELPEVETVRRGLQGALKGSVIKKVLLRRKNLRIPFPKNLAAALEGRTVTEIDRRAKYLLFHFDSDDVLIAHLGMSGRFSVEPNSPKRWNKHDHAVFDLSDRRVVIYNDSRRFGLMTLAKNTHLSSHPLLHNLGPEPFDRAFSAAYLKKALFRRTGSVKAALMDQALVVGVGNIYASEALFLAKVSPNRRACDVAERAPELVSAVRKVLGEAIRSGGSSLRDFMHVSGDAGHFQHRFRVYGRRGKPCLSCGNPIETAHLGGRSSFYCKQCQR